VKFVLTPPDQEFQLQHYRCGPWSIDVTAYAFGQYRIQIWWDGPKGREYRWPDLVQPNF
jgi:hypothetical protein